LNSYVGIAVITFIDDYGDKMPDRLELSKNAWKSAIKFESVKRFVSAIILFLAILVGGLPFYAHFLNPFLQETGQLSAPLLALINMDIVIVFILGMLLGLVALLAILFNQLRIDFTRKTEEAARQWPDG